MWMEASRATPVALCAGVLERTCGSVPIGFGVGVGGVSSPGSSPAVGRVVDRQGLGGEERALFQRLDPATGQRRAGAGTAAGSTAAAFPGGRRSFPRRSTVLAADRPGLKISKINITHITPFRVTLTTHDNRSRPAGATVTREQPAPSFFPVANCARATRRRWPTSPSTAIAVRYSIPYLSQQRVDEISSPQSHANLRHDGSLRASRARVTVWPCSGQLLALVTR